MNDDRLDAELRALAADLDLPRIDPEATAMAVMERIASEPAPAARPAHRVRAWWSRIARLARGRTRIVTAVLAAAIIAAAFTTPVRAVVSEWLGLGGVEVRPGPAVPSAPPPPAVDGDLDLPAAAGMVGFDPVVPPALGQPHAVATSLDGQLLSMSWSTPQGTVRLDQFDRSLAVKIVPRPGESVDLGAADGLWFAQPHDLHLYDPGSAAHPEIIRAAGPTLVWEVGGTTLRLEGFADRERAVEIARSTLGEGT